MTKKESKVLGSEDFSCAQKGSTLELYIDGTDEKVASIHVTEESIQAEFHSSHNVNLTDAHSMMDETMKGISKDEAVKLGSTMNAQRVKLSEPDRYKLPKTVSWENFGRMTAAMKEIIAKKHAEQNGTSHANSKVGIYEKWLVDTCTDVHLVSMSYCRRIGIESKIDKARTITLSVADKKTSFHTFGMVLVPLKIKDVHDTWHRLDIWCHVIDSHDKCIVNNVELHKTHGFVFYYGNNSKGKEGSCMIAKDGVIFALSLDCAGMPILPTHNAPVVTLSKPDTIEELIANLQTKIGAKKASKSSHYVQCNQNEGSTSDSDPDSPDHSGDEGMASDQEDITEHELYCILAERAQQRASMNTTSNDVKDEEEMRLPPGSKKKRKKKNHQRKRTIEPVHTPESWHALIHAGRDISEKTIQLMKGLLFKIDGKLIKGENLSKADFETLDQARLTCRICKQTKMVAPAGRKGIPTCLNCIQSVRDVTDGSSYHRHAYDHSTVSDVP